MGMSGGVWSWWKGGVSWWRNRSALVAEGLGCRGGGILGVLSRRRCLGREIVFFSIGTIIREFGKFFSSRIMVSSNHVQ